MFPYNVYDIQPVSSLKYLGVLIDQHLSGQAMVESIIKKATGRLNFCTGILFISTRIFTKIFVQPYYSGT